MNTQKKIEASTLTDHLTSDASQVKPLLDNVDAEIGDVKADGAYDYDSVLQVGIGAQRHWCTNRHFDKNIVGLLFFHYFHLKIWLSWHLAQQGKVQVVIK